MQRCQPSNTARIFYIKNNASLTTNLIKINNAFIFLIHMELAKNSSIWIKKPQLIFIYSSFFYCTIDLQLTPTLQKLWTFHKDIIVRSRIAGLKQVLNKNFSNW